MTGFIVRSDAQEKLVKRKISAHINLKVPISFVTMSEDDMRQRVPSYRKSLALYTDVDRLVELGVNRSYSVWQEGDYEMIYDVYKSSILQLFDDVEFIQEEITQIKKRPFVVFEFISKVYGDKDTSSGPVVKYTYIQYTVFESQTVVFSFNCPKFQMEKWQATANLIMNSVVIK